jgi:3'-5' exoribonuclease
MDKGKYVSDLAPGSSFTHSVFNVLSPEIKQGKAGSPYAMFNIEDRTGCAAAKLWNVTPEQQRLLSSNSFFYMNGNVDSGQYSGQVTVSSLKPIAESDVNMDDFLTPLPDDHQMHYDRFIRLVKTVKNPHLKQLLRTVFGNPADMLKKFRDAVAAKSMHHSHRGGLIEHSAEVAEMCDKMCDVLPNLNRDLLITCALVHDIGKLEEMEHGVKHGEYTVDGALIGHIVLGTQIILAAMGPDFPPMLRKIVMHMILSHHGTGEFGSPKEPATAEAYVLSSCDELSAKAFQTRFALKNARAGQVNVKTPNGWAYVGETGLEESIPSQAPPCTSQSLLTFEVDCARLSISGTNETRDVALPEKGADYLLRVNDSSMDASGILPGDLVFVKKGAPDNTSEALVAVCTEGKAQGVRRLAKDASQNSVLESDDPQYPTIAVNSDTVITGRITGLIREL